MRHRIASSLRISLRFLSAAALAFFIVSWFCSYIFSWEIARTSRVLSRDVRCLAGRIDYFRLNYDWPISGPVYGWHFRSPIPNPELDDNFRSESSSFLGFYTRLRSDCTFVSIPLWPFIFVTLIPTVFIWHATRQQMPERIGVPAMPTPLNPVVKRALIITLLCLTGLATLGTVACIAGGRGYGAVEMGLMIGLGLGFLLILCFAAFTAIEHRFLRFPAFAGMTLSALLMLSLPIFAWLLEHRSYYYSSTAPSSIDYYELSGRCIFSAFTLAGLLCIVPWVLVTKFQSFFPRLIQIATAACLLLLFCFWHPVIWAAPLAGSYESEQLFYTLIALSVAGLLATALLKKFCAIRILRPVTYSEITLEIKCPCCHNTGQFPHGPSACPHCALKFNVEIEEPVCPGCGYNLHNLTTPRCPECGRNLPGIVPPVAQAHPVTA